MNKVFYRNAKQEEPPNHRKAKEIVAPYLVAAGYSVEYEVKLPEIDLHLVPELSELWGEGSFKRYRVDLLGTRKLGKIFYVIDVEVDGESHFSANRNQKDKVRDIAMPFAIQEHFWRLKKTGPGNVQTRIARFDKLGLLGGDYSPADIKAKLGL